MSEKTTLTGSKTAVNIFIKDLVVLKSRAGELGLYKTMHSLEEPMKTVGWELAEQMTLKKKNVLRNRRGKPVSRRDVLC